MDTRVVPLADDGLTSVRREIKVLLDEDEARALAATLARIAPPVESAIVAVYFDSASAQLAARVERTPGDCVKVRVKAYAPDRSAIPGRVVLEVKRERGGLTSKDRTWLPPAEVSGVIARVLAPSFGALAPVLATSYRRRVYQASPSWRVTLDDALRFHAADWSVFAGGAIPSRGVFWLFYGCERRVVAELKHGPGGLP
ncbi:MAG TPA: VTC domain-containing protein, partial [Anaeromyxobacteraceae bacterium]|nr:VTC domain-containing protein [Anaeromyxobacteraceae bacterium]